jgi:ribosomal protein L11 methyltransferase
MHPKKTYELQITFPNAGEQEVVALKQSVMEWLIGKGEESFVEGIVDGIDLEFDYENPDHDYYQELGGDAAALSLYRYDIEYLRDVRAGLEQRFGTDIQCRESAMETEVWLEGWKASFRSFTTDQFVIYPPWEPEARRTHLIPLEVEPGMAFGTGQHATTRLCLQELERLPQFDRTRPILDVGTGTGILAIALAKLGYTSIVATDSDADAVVAAKANAEANHTDFVVERGSVPESLQGQCGLVIANILMVVLRRIAQELADAVVPEGYLLVSGVLESELMEMKAFGEQVGLTYCHYQELGGWVAVLFQKPSP